MNTSTSPTHPWLLLQTRHFGTIINPPIYPSLPKPKSTKIYAEGKSKNRGFPGRSKDVAKIEPTIKPPTASDDDEELSPVVVNRMIRRILAYVGFPLGVGLGLLSLFGYLRDNHIEVPIWAVFASTFLTLGCSALGVPVGALSTNLDPEEDGSVLGLEELSYNWVKMWEDDS